MFKFLFKIEIDDDDDDDAKNEDDVVFEFKTDLFEAELDWIKLDSVFRF
jgi:hypothetical protein